MLVGDVMESTTVMTSQMRQTAVSDLWIRIDGLFSEIFS